MKVGVGLGVMVGSATCYTECFLAYTYTCIIYIDIHIFRNHFGSSLWIKHAFQFTVH